MPDPWLLVQMTALLLVIGGLAGVIAGLLGVGGGIVLVPAFFYAFTVLGYGGPQLMQVCLATSLATIVFTSAISVRAHYARGAVDLAILRGWAPGIAIGAVLGVAVAVGLASVVLQGIFGVLGVAVALYLAFGRAHWRLGNGMPTGLAKATTAPGLGFLSVLMGIGGGSFGVPLMTLYGVAIHRAVATAAGFGLAVSVPSVAGFLLVRPEQAPPLTLGAINLPAFLIVIAVSLQTTRLGVKLAHSMDPKPLKRVFAVVLMFTAGNMLRKALGF